MHNRYKYICCLLCKDYYKQFDKTEEYFNDNKDVSRFVTYCEGLYIYIYIDNHYNKFHTNSNRE